MTNGFDDARPGELLDAYLDGLLDEASRARFERAIETRADLRQMLERQRAIDASLARSLGPPPDARLRVILDEARGAPTGAGAGPWHLTRRALPLALAASLLLCVTGVWLIWSVATRGGPGAGGYEPLPGQTMAEVYAVALDRDFEPDVVCRDADEFDMWFRQQFRRGLRLREPLPEGLAALGLGYSNSVSPSTIHILAVAGGSRIIVFVDRLERQCDWQPDPGSGLHLHRAAVGDLALYELSPLETPKVLPHFYDPESES